MKLTIVILIFLLPGAPVAFAQKETAKFNPNGDLIWISDLLPDTTGCEPAKIFTGTVTRAETLDSENAVGYDFTLRPANRRTQKFRASLPKNEGAVIVDFENMLTRGRRLKVKARQCGSGGFWPAEEIWRL